MKLTQEDIVEIIKLFEQSKFDVCQLEIGDLKLTLSNDSRLQGRAPAPAAAATIQSKPALPSSAATSAPQSLPAQAISAPGSVVQQPASAQAEGLVAIVAPIIGTFYEAPEPGAKRFVDVGSLVEEDTTVGLIEVMKVFNAVTAGVGGRVERILVKNEQFVDYGQSLFMLRPD